MSKPARHDGPRTYIGLPGGDVIVRVGASAQSQRDLRLPPRLDLVNHSPSGFAWGYGGSGPAQLALAILCDHLQHDQLALSLYQLFKWECISKLPSGQGFVLSDLQVAEALSRVEAEAGHV